jgi:hypothetical protein
MLCRPIAAAAPPSSGYQARCGRAAGDRPADQQRQQDADSSNSAKADPAGQLRFSTISAPMITPNEKPPNATAERAPAVSSPRATATSSRTVLPVMLAGNACPSPR